MGFNTSMLILNDCLSEIEQDPELGKKISQGVGMLARGEQVNITTVGGKCRSNGITLVETHHADTDTVVMFGGNRAQVLSNAVWADAKEGDLSPDVKYLRSLAAQMGYTLTKRKGGPRGW